jgi:hypothetical protein
MPCLAQPGLRKMRDCQLAVLLRKMRDCQLAVRLSTAIACKHPPLTPAHSYTAAGAGAGTGTSGPSEYPYYSLADEL